MSKADARSRTTRSAAAKRNVAWLSSPKLALPVPQERVLPRNAIVERLASASGATLVTIVAPAGYGKTTLLQQWAQHVPDVAYIRLDPTDNDPTLLVAYIAAALDRVEPLGELTSHLGSLRSLQSTVLPRLSEAIWHLRKPVVLMLDDLHVIHQPASLDALSWLATRLPPTVTLALASREAPDFPVARLRAEGHLLEIGPRDLGFDDQEVLALAAIYGVDLSEEAARTLVARTEGWPAAVYLAMLAANGTDGVIDPGFGGNQTTLADYMREELLAPLDPDDQRLLIRASALETLSGPLCDAALETTGSLSRLRALERRNAFLVSLDGSRTAYRFHRLFGEFLVDELAAQEPDSAATIRLRASAWHQDHGDIEQAAEYAHLAGDLDALTGLVGQHVMSLFWTGRLATLTRWLGWFDRDELRTRSVAVAVIRGWVEAVQGQTRSAELWLAAAQRSTESGPMPDGTATKEPWIALLRGAMVRDGVAVAVADARVTREGIAADGPWWPTALAHQIIAHVLTGSLPEAETAAIEAAEVAASRGAAPAMVTANGWRAVLALQRGDTAAAASAAERGLAAVEAVGLEDYPMTALLYAVGARLAVAGGSKDDVRSSVARFNRLRPQLTSALPWLAVMARVEVIRAYIALGDAAAARALLLEISDVQRVRPDLGWLATDAETVRDAVEGMRGAGPGPWSLTSAELRLLVYLPTHLTFPEIAERMYLSPYTIKTQAISIYSKLGVATRRGAIEQAAAVGLLDGSVLRHPGGATGIG
jgi:LuxR family maltose regulon positive regulatory protein